MCACSCTKSHFFTPLYNTSFKNTFKEKTVVVGKEIEDIDNLMIFLAFKIFGIHFPLKYKQN